MGHRNRRFAKKGTSLIIGILSLGFIIPMIGLAFDVAVLYAVRARLQAAVDGASLAAARALSLGSSTAAQAASAKQNAVNWFYVNFPAGNLSTSATSMDASSVQVFDDPGNPNLRNVTVTAATQAPTYFMRFFHLSTTTVSAVGNASRRDVAVMMVLDRSGSMNNSPGACAQMIAAAKTFTGQFAAGRDRIGLVSFAENVYLHSSPVTTFQTTLGYANSTGSGSGEIDSIVCSGGTNTAQAISVAYNELYRLNMPGALNVIMFETDGLPNAMTLNFWDSGAAVAGIAAASNCTDANNKKKSAGGFATLASLRNWTAGQTFGVGSYVPNVPAGLVGSISSSDPGGGTNFFTMFNYWTNTKSSNFNTNIYLNSTVNGCAFASSHTPTTLATDLAWLPNTDVYGNSLDTTYNSVTRSGGRIVSNSWSTYHAAALNAADNAAFRARTNATLPTYFFGIGLGGTSTSPPDYVLMQRMTNDPSGDDFNSPPLFPACASSANCVTYPDQPQGTFVFSTNQTALGQAFLSISSQILRLSR